MIPRAPRLFGRDRDLSVVRALLDEGSAAIVGPPGVGKTELALHLAATSEREVVWVDVSSALDGAGVRAAVARELGIPLRTRDEGEGRAAITRAASARGDLLFVIDGAEVCLEEVCALAERVTALVVSRTPVDGAHVLEPLEPEAARALYVERALAADPTRDTRVTLRALAVLGGYPWAIELAAARPNALHSADLDVDLGDPYVVNAAIEWAIGELSPEGRSALARASAFERSFSFDAFERVSGCSFDVLTFLADARLVRVSERRASIDRMVRAIALRDLDDRAFRNALAAHAAFVGERALASVRALEGEEAPRPPATADLLAAHATALVEPAVSKDGVCAIALALVLIDPARASIFDLDRLDATIAVAGSGPLGGRVRVARAALARSLGRPAEALAAFSSLREAARVSGDRLLEARALVGLGDLALDAGAIDDALRHDEEALARGALDAPNLLAHVLPCLARGRRARGDLDDATLLLERAIVAVKHGGGPHARALLHVELARVKLDQGHHDEACAILERTLPRLEADVRAVARCLSLLGRARDDRALLARGLRAARAAAAPRSEAEACVAIAAHTLLRGEVETARNHALSAIELSATDGDLVGAARATGYFAVVLSTLDAREEAETAFVTAAACGDPWVRAAIEVQRGHLELAHARLARVRGDLETARALEASAARRVRETHSVQGDDPRLAMRVLSHALEGVAEERALSVELEHARVKFGDGTSASLENRPTLRRLFDALVRRRVEAPGVPLAFTDLLNAGWPGERIAPKTGKERLHTSLGTLRDLGLRGALLTDEQGWRIAPEIPVLLR